MNKNNGIVKFKKQIIDHLLFESVQQKHTDEKLYKNMTKKNLHIKNVKLKLKDDSKMTHGGVTYIAGFHSPQNSVKNHLLIRAQKIMCVVCFSLSSTKESCSVIKIDVPRVQQFTITSDLKISFCL